MVRHKSPQRKCRIGQFQVQTIFLAVADERSELTRLHVIVQNEKKMFVEFERIVSLLHQLECAIEKLCEHRRHFFGIRLDVTASIAEFVTERKPILFDERLESLNRAIEWIAHQCRQ